MTKIEQHYRDRCAELDALAVRQDFAPGMREGLLLHKAEKALRAAYRYRKKKCPSRRRLLDMSSEVVRRLLK